MAQRWASMIDRNMAWVLIRFLSPRWEGKLAQSGRASSPPAANFYGLSKAQDWE